jgi:hypothetical protein
MIIGIIAFIAGSLYPFFQAQRVWETKSTIGLSRYFIILFVVDKLTSFTYSLHKDAYFLSAKYLIGIICALILFYFRFIYKKKDEL